MKQDKGFTLLELLIVITLIAIVFSIGGFVFINNIKSMFSFSSELNNSTVQLSFINQLTAQLFSKYEKRYENIKIDEDRISFYTGYPVFYEGFVRAEYILKKNKDTGYTTVYYEEFPYIDGNLGFDGLKKSYIGKFKNLKISVYDGGKWYINYRNKKFPAVIKVSIDGNDYYITVNGKMVR